MRKTYPLFLLIALALLASGYIFGGASIALGINLPCLLIVLGISSAMSLSVSSAREITSYFREPFKSEDEADRKILRNGEIFFRSLRYYFFLSGGIGTLTGVLILLSMVDSNEAIGLGMAIALITLYYGMVFSLILAIPFEVATRKKLVETEPTKMLP